MSEFWFSVPGSFDESVFVNPKTGGFGYPKYKSPKSAIVKIKDTTNYREEFTTLDGDGHDSWDAMSLFELELSNSNLEFELSSFEEVFDLIVKRAELNPKLTGLGSELCSLAIDFEWFLTQEYPWLPEGFGILSKSDRLIWEAGLFQTYLVEPGSALEVQVRQATLECSTAEQLKKICRNNRLPKIGKKDDLIGRILASNLSVEPLPLVKPNRRKLDSLLDLMTDVYINDVKQSIDRWHPLIIKNVWDSAQMYSDFLPLSNKIQAVLANPYWANRLTLQKEK